MIYSWPTKKNQFLPITIFLFLLFAGCGDEDNVFIQAGDRVDPRPNIILVVTDDQGFADIGAQGISDEVLTPNIDEIAQHGVRMTVGYTTAPQCAPSRTGIITGRYQQRIGFEDNTDTPLTLSTDTIAQRLKQSGYSTGYVGKWHLDIDNNSRKWITENYPTQDIKNFSVEKLPLETRKQYYPESRGFDDVFFGNRNTYWRNFNLNGQSVNAGSAFYGDFRIDIVSHAALSFINRHRAEPFFLIVSYYGPHVPLEAPEKYLENIPQNIPKRRRYALAMLSAIDYGVGSIARKLEDYHLEKDTILFFISDNGAPLGITMADLPINDSSGIWDGSINDPWIGEKGMLSEAGIRVPFLVQWKGTIPNGAVYEGAVSTLDIGATALSAAESTMVHDLDGIDLIPILTSEVITPIERTLFWRFWDQVAIRKGRYKYLLAGKHEFLFDLDDPDHEYVNLVEAYPDKASQMKNELTQWAQSMQNPRMTRPFLTGQELDWYNAYFDIQSQ